MKKIIITSSLFLLFGLVIGQTYQIYPTYPSKPSEGGSTTTQPPIVVDGEKEGSVTVVSPNGGEMWKIGTRNVILWRYSLPANSDRVYANIYLEGPVSGVIGVLPVQSPETTLSSLSERYGRFVWDTTYVNNHGELQKVVESKDYKVVVELSSAPACQTKICPLMAVKPYGEDKSDAPFAIVSERPTPPPQLSLQVVYPNGGETLERNKVHIIRWEFKGGPERVSPLEIQSIVPYPSRTVSIDLYRSVACITYPCNPVLVKRLGTASLLQKSWPWRIDQDIPNGDNYLIKITAKVNDVEISDFSDGTFSIVSGETPPSTGNLEEAIRLLEKAIEILKSLLRPQNQ